MVSRRKSLMVGVMDRLVQEEVEKTDGHTLEVSSEELQQRRLSGGCMQNFKAGETGGDDLCMSEWTCVVVE